MSDYVMVPRWDVVKCPKCGDTNCFPTHIKDMAMCVKCGSEFDMNKPAAPPPATDEEMVERVRDIILRWDRDSYENARAVLAIAAPHYETRGWEKGREQAAKIAESMPFESTTLIATAIRASKEPTP